MYIFYAKHHEEIESRGAAIENEAGNDVNLIQVHPLRYICTNIHTLGVPTR
jgi:hypothetical protein